MRKHLWYDFYWIWFPIVKRYGHFKFINAICNDFYKLRFLKKFINFINYSKVADLKVAVLFFFLNRSATYLTPQLLSFWELNRYLISIHEYLDCTEFYWLSTEYFEDEGKLTFVRFFLRDEHFSNITDYLGETRRNLNPFLAIYPQCPSVWPCGAHSNSF
jgi:hypothetical protein